MERVIQAKKLISKHLYIEYSLPKPHGGGPPVTILFPEKDQGDVAFLFIPNAPDIDVPPNFLNEILKFLWQNFEYNIDDFVFYSFDPRIEPMEYDSEIGEFGHGSRIAYLQSSEHFFQMYVELPLIPTKLMPGMTANAAEEAEEMGYTEGDGIKMLLDLDENTRREWWGCLRLDETKVSNDPCVRMRAIFEQSEPVAFLPFLSDSQGKVKIEKICFKNDCFSERVRDWRHVQRVLFRSVHEQCTGKQLWVDCNHKDYDFWMFLGSWGYDAGPSYWTGLWD